MGDQTEAEFESEEPPAELWLDQSVQENLLENARVGISTLHQCDIDFSVDDGEQATEDNITVTGFTVE